MGSYDKGVAMRSNIFKVLVSLTLLTAALPAFADDSAKGATINTTELAKQKSPGKLNALGLSDEQKQAISALKAKFKESAKPKKEELLTHRKNIQDMLAQSTIDKTQIMAEQDKINALSAELASAKLAFRIDSGEQLTVEQRQKLRDRVGKMRAGRGKHHHKRGFGKDNAQPAQS
ncbi:MAG: hypothetical protein QG625_1439 [Cyanobacteriota bacterium erpe_2018_sw_39hr_WHONDRS-SW48-000098_B_bin.30]|nr:hypothetical protein [Cyanobacteriota bacterium erpe_2018_sw_39hr_WHONDRS-SW48-000098_B_bin.30]